MGETWVQTPAPALGRRLVTEASLEGTVASSLTADSNEAHPANTLVDSPTAVETLKYGPLFPFHIEDIQLYKKGNQPTAKLKRIGTVTSLVCDMKYLRN